METFPPSPRGDGLYDDDFYPFVDRFGQYRHATWADKVADEADLLARTAAESVELDAVRPAAFGRFGGWRFGPRLEPTGFFRRARIDGRWWLVDPEGYLFLSSGVTTVGSVLRTDASGAASMKTGVSGRERFFEPLPAAGTAPWNVGAIGVETATVTSGEYQGQRPLAVNFAAWNALRQFPEATTPEALRAATSALAFRRLESWGFTTIAGWSDTDLSLRAGRRPYTHVLIYTHPGLINGSTVWLDYFRDQFLVNLRARVSEEIGRTIGDPWNVGFYIDNERDWTKSNQSARGLGLTVLASAAEPLERYAKQALRDLLRDRHGTIAALNAAWGANYASWDDVLVRRDVVPDAAASAADFDAFELLYAETYFRRCRDVLRELAPQHLYLGCRFTTGGRASLVRTAGRFADVVTVNIYGSTVRLITGTEDDVPLMSTEFHFFARDTGLFSDAVATSTRRTTQALRADSMRGYLDSAFSNPRFVGAHWFQYFDYPTAGRLNSRNMNSNLGLVAATNLPYRAMVDAARVANHGMYRLRWAPPKRQSTADAAVAEATPDAVSGTGTTLAVAPGREALLEFDLANVASVVDRAILLLTPVAGAEWATHALEEIPPGSFAETTATWNTRPASGGVELGRWTTRAGLPVEIDVTSSVRRAWLADRRVAFRVVAVSGGAVSYAARESGDASVRPQVLLVTSPATRSDWTARHFLAGSAAAADAADPDGDGRPNLLEYALGREPLRADAGGDARAVLGAGGRPALRFLRARADVAYVVEGSADLADWQVVASDPGAAGDSVEIEATDPTIRFLRLRVAPR